MGKIKRFTHSEPRKYTAKLKTKKMRLTGDERYWIQERIEKLKVSERTVAEKRLLQKVK